MFGLEQDVVVQPVGGLLRRFHGLASRRLAVAATFLAIASAFLADAASAAPPLPEQFLVDTWQREDGLPQISVLALAQDSDGYLWLGTEGGLARFDGRRFTVFDRRGETALSHDYVGALLADEDGGLWIGTYGGLLHRAGGTFRRFSSQDGLADDGVRALVRDAQGILWVGTAKGLSRLGRSPATPEAVTFETLSAADGLPHEDVLALAADPSGILWVGTVGGLARIADGRIETVLVDEAEPRRILTLLVDRAGTLWIGSHRGLRSWSAGAGAPRAEPAFDGHSVLALHQDPEGALWVGTDDGLYRRRGDGLRAFSTAEGLPGSDVTALLTDPEGSLWVGTRLGGLARMGRSKLAVLGTAEGLADEIAWTVYQGPSGTVWIGTAGGLNRIGPAGEVETVSGAELEGTAVRSLLEDRSGRLWIGTFRDGLLCLDDGLVRRFTRADGLGGDGVLALAETDGGVWAGTSDGGLSRFSEGRLRTFTTADGLADDAVRALQVDAEGTLWIGTQGGLSRFRGGVFTSFTRLDGLPDERIRALHVDAEGTLWLGTETRGLVRFRDGTFFNVTSGEGLLDDYLHQVLEDGHGRLWMSSNRGIFRVEKAEIEALEAGRVAAVTTVAYSETDGMRGSECNGGSQPAGMRSADGRLWWPTIRGVAVIDGDEPPRNAVPPRVVIEEVRIDGEPADASPVVRPRGSGELEMQFTALSFVAPGKVRFRHRLHPFETAFSEESPERTAYYTNIPAGRYRFEVLAANSDGVWNEAGASFELVLTPPFYRTWAFYGLCAVAAAVLAWAAYRLRVRQLTRRTVELETEVDRRTEELARQKWFLEQTNKRLLRINQELNRVSQEKEDFVSIVAHDMRAPLSHLRDFSAVLREILEPLHQMLDHSLPQLEQEVLRTTTDAVRDEVPEALDFIEASTARLERLVAGILRLAQLGSRELHPEPVALTEVVEATLQVLGGRIEMHGVRVEIGSLPEVVVDRPSIELVVEHLLSNAVRYLEPGRPGAVEVYGVRTERESTVHVRDNGRGIAPEDRHLVFRVFGRSPGQDDDGEGEGLGLAFVQTLVRRHGGHLWFDSTPGEGSTFSFTLPNEPQIEPTGTRPRLRLLTLRDSPPERPPEPVE